MANYSKSYGKYTIQTIVNPGTFWCLEQRNETQNETKQYISPKDIKRFRRFEQIHTGQMVAVNLQNEFHRGLIIDIYNKQNKTIYFVLLVDSGSSVETCADSLFIIRSSEIRNKKSNAFEILLHGIEPVTFELVVTSLDLDSNVDGSNTGGIFHKRSSNKWSPAAFNFIKDLFKENSCIYVKQISVTGASITGDVYYKQEGDDGLKSLAETLCSKDFAIFTKNQPKITEMLNWEALPKSTVISVQEGYFNGIERRIPNIPEKEDVLWEDLSVVNLGLAENVSETCSSGCSDSDRSTYSDSDKCLKYLGQSARAHFSHSWIVKKMNGKFDSSSSSAGSDSTEKTGPKVNLFRVIQRNMQLYDKHKLNT